MAEDDRPDKLLPWLPLPGFVHRLTIAQRVRIGSIVGAVVIVVISIIASILIRHLTDTLSQVVQQADFEQNTLVAMKDAVSAEDTSIQSYLITGDAASLDSFSTAHERFSSAATLLQSRTAAGADRSAAQDVSGLESEFRRLAQQEIDLSRQGFPNAAAFHWQTEGQHAGQALTDRLDQLAARRSIATHDRLTTAQRTETASRLLFAPIVVITALLALVTALLASGSITRRVNQLDRTIEAIELGDFHVVLNENRGDELGRLARSIRAMARALDVETHGREALLAERARSNEELTALYDLSRTVNQSLDTEEVLRLALVKLLGYTNMSAGLALLYDEAADELRLALTEGLGEESHAEIAGLLEEDSSQEFFAAAMSREGLTRLDLASYPIETQPFRTAIAVPLRAKGHGRGLLVLATAAPLDMTPDEERLVEGLAKQVGTALEHASLYSKSRQLAAAEERNRLARELHDSVTQSLFSMSMMAQALPSLIERSSERAVERATRLSELARGALAEMRMLILELRPAALHEMGLVVALERHVAGFGSREDLDATLCVDGLQRRLPGEHEEALFRIAQEALNNVSRHAGATTVTVSLEFEPETASVTVTDNGNGMPDVPDAGGFGLISMRERAENLGGSLSIASERGRGVTVAATVPVPAPTTSIAG